jgi:alpha-tubulin suppressor-like RCC1 family protein
VIRLPALADVLMRGRQGFLGAVIVVLIACEPIPTAAPGPREGWTTPVLVLSDSKFSTVVAGFVHTCALDYEGAAYCWGGNDYSQLGVDLPSSDCGLLSCSRTPVAVSGGLRFRTLAAGWVHNCGITTDGDTYCWGGGAVEKRGYLGDGQLKRSARPVRVLTDSAFASITIGDGHTCALTSSGKAFCWGANGSGQLGDGTFEDRATPVPIASDLRFQHLSAGANHTCGVTIEHEGYCWGGNRWGELGTGDVVYGDLSAARSVPQLVAGGHSFTSVVSGWEHTCALATDARTLCWGRNELARQLGDDSDVTHRGTPSPIAGALQFVELSAGPLATCGRVQSGDTFCWGGNQYGALGNGEKGRPVGHPMLTQWSRSSGIVVGQSHACGLAPDRSLWCCGDQSAGQF